eukprot:TRINITY_DN4322_c0_g1_i2.p1 TRINITY_DN4322_c0_g1~~TRINITY_DN4322_c0_g1_i2.p1  ORF type:complete len:421 (-),score=122.55 TRINITY_DN4322_c0_g1_i2:75-1337(-)
MNEIVELPNGKIVCAQHYLEVCGICCMDFTDMNVDSQDKEKGKKYYTDTFGFRYCNAHDEEVCKKCGVNEAAFNKKVEAKEKESKDKKTPTTTTQPTPTTTKPNINNNVDSGPTSTAPMSSTAIPATTTIPSSEDDDSMPSLVSETDLEYCETKRKEGNEHFSKNDFNAALKSYSEGIIRDPYCLTLLSNRAACYLNLNDPAEALKDAEKVCAIDREHVKANFRRIKSLVLLGRIREAQTLFREFRVKFPSEDSFIQELTVLLENAQQQQSQPQQSQSQQAPPTQSTSQLSKKERKKKEREQAQSQTAQTTQTQTQTQPQPSQPRVSPAQTPAPAPTPTPSTPNKEPPAKKEEEKPAPVYEEPPRREKRLECTICMENDVQIMMRPCNHAVLCKDCYKQLPEKICPICRKPIKRVFNVYL